jgi:hypothetical protein
MLWNVVDENGNPNIGPFVNARGTITIDSKTKEIVRGTDYWVPKHYTHAARRGSRRIASQGGAEGVAHAHSCTATAPRCWCSATPPAAPNRCRCAWAAL